MGIVFAKTRKGQDEIATKAGGLSPRVRRVLIFVDGKRTVDDLRSLLQSDDLQHTLGDALVFAPGNQGQCLVWVATGKRQRSRQRFI